MTGQGRIGVDEDRPHRMRWKRMARKAWHEWLFVGAGLLFGVSLYAPSCRYGGIGTIQKVCRKGFCIGEDSCARSEHVPADVARARKTIKKRDRPQ